MAEAVTASPDLSLVVAVYFEEECVAEFVRRIRIELDDGPLEYELVFVDDGSTDRTVEIIAKHAATDPRIKLIQLSKNNGKEVAVTAGIEHACGKRIIMMDPDLQDPPEQIHNFVAKLDEGYDLVFGVRERKADTFINRLFSRLFWYFLDKMTGLAIPKNLAVMRIFNQNFSREFQRYPERSRFIEGVFIHIGMRQAAIVIPNHERFAGRSKFNMRRRTRLALNAVLAFGDRPIKLSVILGVFLCTAAGLFAVVAIVGRLFFHVGLSGWTSTIVAVVFLGGLQTMILGLIGLYVGRVYTETKGRPLFHIQRKINLP